jgi:L-ribulose-5-phosphate 4-epimerase
MPTAETEGVIKFACHHQDQAIIANAAIDKAFQKLKFWREKFRQLGLVGGNEPERYQGYGYGNLSIRIEAQKFLISGTQSGHIKNFKLEHCALVESYEIEKNEVWSVGKIKPSSESMTHASIFHALPTIQAVFHAHHPKIWQNALKDDTPKISSHIPYGTPAMAQAVAQMVQNLFTEHKNLFFIMAGHEDGIMSAGENADDAGELLVMHHAKNIGTRF